MQFSLKQKQTVVVIIAIAAIIWSAALYARYNESRISSVEVEAPLIKAEKDSSLTVKVGIGTSEPKGSVHVKNALKNTPGVLLEMPPFRESFFCHTQCSDDDPNCLRSCNVNDKKYATDCFKDRLSYLYGTMTQWRGGEREFGKWRQFYNWDEHGWTLTYNAQTDFTANWCTPQSGWPGKDTEDISSLMRFDVGEGNSSFLEMWWSAAAPTTTAPFHGPAPAPGGAYYNFLMGCSSQTGGCRSINDGKLYKTLPVRMLVGAPQSADAVLSLAGNTDGINLRAAGTPVGSWDSTKLLTIENINTSKTLMAFYVPPPWDSDFNNDFLHGNVGIGVTPNNHKLSVVGTAGLTTGTAWTQISDSRFKNVQSELKGGSLEKIMNLHPVSYQWNSLYQDKYGKKDGLNYGFIAQEVQKVIPEFITQDKEGYLWYNPSGFEAILTAAMQERQKQIESLKTEIKELKIKYDL